MRLEEKIVIMNKKFSISVIILSIVLLFTVLVGIYRQFKSDTSLQYKLPTFDKTLVNDWLKALKENNVKKALSSASKMVLASSPYVPLPYYYDMVFQNGINSKFFNPPFTILDYLYWKDAFNIRHIVNKALRDTNNTNIPKLFFTIIYKNIKLIKYNKKSQRSAFLFEIWNKKKCDILDKYLLFSEFMVQAGYQVQIVVLFSDIKKPPIHIIAEIRKKNEVYVCDFFIGGFWNKSIKELTNNNKILTPVWKQKWIKGLDHLLFKTEVCAMSYRKINQQLYKYLTKSNNKSIPIIGLDPYKKMITYKKKYYPDITNNPKRSFILGIEPFSMIKNSPYFPKKWLIKDK